MPVAQGEWRAAAWLLDRCCPEHWRAVRTLEASAPVASGPSGLARLGELMGARSDLPRAEGTQSPTRSPSPLVWESEFEDVKTEGIQHG